MSKLRVEPLGRQESLRDRALAILRQGIMAGELEAGGLYSATGLANELGISVSPVREAMLTLVNDGIMEPVRNRGFRVVTLSRQALADIVEVRILLQAPTVAGLAERDLTQWWPELQRHVEGLEESAAAGELTTFLQLDRDFHLRMLEIAGNERLVEIVATLRDQTRVYGLAHLAHEGRLTDIAAEHRQILEYIDAGDVDGTRELMSIHLGHILREWSDEQ